MTQPQVTTTAVTTMPRAPRKEDVAEERNLRSVPGVGRLYKLRLPFPATSSLFSHLIRLQILAA
jgi:hypothetical protein